MNKDLLHDPKVWLEPLKLLHSTIRKSVVDVCERSAVEAMATVAREEEGDTIYAVDRVSEELLIEFFNQHTELGPIVLIAEGLHGGQVVIPESASEDDAKWRIIVDPIDGTRPLMYQKRGAWILTGVAPNLGPTTSLLDIQFAIQTEIPTVKQHLSDCAWSFRGEGVSAERFNRLTGEVTPLKLQPSSSKTIAHGYAQIARFFPGAREELAAIDEEVVMGALGPVQEGKARCFEDQYASTGGQLYELMSGHDRFTADLRPFMEPLFAARGTKLGICCHPYDICTELIARELGVIITDGLGRQLNAILSVEPNISWAGYANAAIQKQIEPLLGAALRNRGLTEG